MGIFDLFKRGRRKKGVKPPIDLKQRFDLQTRSGQGSMSKVWRAYDREIGRVVCLKLLDKEKTAKFEARFIGRNKPPEGEICMAMKHDNIVRTYDYGRIKTGEPFMSMEWIDGLGLNFLVETKHERLRAKGIDYLCQLCDAVDYMHRVRYMHRDLCPRNAMVTSEETVKLIDFGLTIPYTPRFCEPGNRTGTSDYLAPEIIKRQTTDHRVDIFSLGVTAYEIFTGALPWPKALNSMEMLLKHINQPGKDPRDVMPEMSDEMHALLVKAIDRDPNKRYQSAVEFRAALRELPEA